MIVQGTLDPEHYNYKCFRDESEEDSYICLGFPKKTDKDKTEEKESTKEDTQESPPKFISNRCPSMGEFASFRQ